MKELLSIVSLKKAAEGRKDTMWNDPERYSVIADIDMVGRFLIAENSDLILLKALQAIALELEDELKSSECILPIIVLLFTSLV
jgi:hypothetical protein